MASRTEPRSLDTAPSRRQELFMFALLAILIWPMIAVAVVDGYGFLVWMWQLIFGPPGPPG
jgi:nitrate reductase NapE